MEDKNKELWEKCVAFHGHACGGLTIGYKAALYAMELLGLDFSKDEQAVCIAENDACGVDAVQVILGCSIGKGNLLFRLRGKQAFSFYNRETGASVRLVMRKGVKGGGEPDRLAYYQSLTPEELFEKKPVPQELPEPARLFQSYDCDCCGESTAEHMLILQNGKKLCRDCYTEYRRFGL